MNQQSSINYFMETHGWTDVWYPGKNHWYVGIWHDEFDLLCVKRCETEEEAEKWLSPKGTTILDACMQASKICELQKGVEELS